MDERDALGIYLQKIRKIPLISREEENKLAIDAQNGDIAARNKLVQSHLRFVVSVAKSYQNNGMALEDLISEGNIGLIHAIEHYDVQRGLHFISYAVWWIRQSIMKGLMSRHEAFACRQTAATSCAKLKSAAAKCKTNRAIPQNLRKLLKCFRIRFPICARFAILHRKCCHSTNKAPMGVRRALKSRSLTMIIHLKSVRFWAACRKIFRRRSRFLVRRKRIFWCGALGWTAMTQNP